MQVTKASCTRNSPTTVQRRRYNTEMSLWPTVKEKKSQTAVDRHRQAEEATEIDDTIVIPPSHWANSHSHSKWHESKYICSGSSDRPQKASR